MNMSKNVKFAVNKKENLTSEEALDSLKEQFMR
jgi:hypothetical protein